MRPLVWLLTAALLVSCSDPAGPLLRAEGDLRFVRQSPAAPPLFTTTASFYAKVGESRGVSLYYEDPVAPGTPGVELLEFDVPANSLYRKPDGTAFAPGDSILITVTVTDVDLFRFEFQPAGLRFDPQAPAQLEIEYFNGDHDFDDDGDEDADDSAIERTLALWYQATATDPWTQLVAALEIETDEIEADILGFSRFAVAW